MRANDAEDATVPRVFGVTVSPLGVRRWRNFTANRRGFWSLWIFLALFTVTLFAELVANDKPLLVRYNGDIHAPVLFAYTETDFGGEFDLEADYRDPYIQDLIRADGWLLWPPIPFAYDTIDYELEAASPARPSARHWLGTDDQARDVLARVIYGFRISVLFGLALTLLSSVIGVAAGAVHAMVATLTFMPFILSGSVTVLTALDFLGFGLPFGSPSLGELLSQGRNNLQAPWLGITGFVVIGVMLSLLVFIGEAVRDAFDPRKLFE